MKSMRRWERLVWLVATMRCLAACSDAESEAEGSSEPKPRAVGAPCIEDDEWAPDFSGFAVGDLNVATLSTRCDSGMCIVNNFQGRVSCPYGQSEAQAMTDSQCFVPDSEDPITVPVEPQRLDRRASKTVTCSCQCDGPAGGPFCTCPSGTVCEYPFANIGLPPPPMPGKYCIPVGALYDPREVLTPEFCDATPENCGDPRPYPPP